MTISQKNASKFEKSENLLKDKLNNDSFYRSPNNHPNSTTTNNKSDYIKSALWMLFSCFWKAVAVTLHKYIFLKYPDMGPNTQNTYRYFVSLVLSFIILKLYKIPLILENDPKDSDLDNHITEQTHSSIFAFYKSEFHKTCKWNLFIRTFFGAFSGVCFIYSVLYLRVTTQGILGNLSGIFTSVFGVLILKEKLLKSDIALIIICIVASSVLIGAGNSNFSGSSSSSSNPNINPMNSINNPINSMSPLIPMNNSTTNSKFPTNSSSTDNFENNTDSLVGIIFILGYLCLESFRNIFQKKIAKNFNVFFVIFTVGWLCGLICFAFVIILQESLSISLKEHFMMILIGMTDFFFLIGSVMAINTGTLVFTQQIYYSQIVFAFILSVIVLGEKHILLDYVCAVVIVGCNLYRIYTKK